LTLSKKRKVIAPIEIIFAKILTMGSFLTAFTKGFNFFDIILRLDRQYIGFNEQLSHLAGFGVAFCG
jgi:hypothetical protein